MRSRRGAVPHVRPLRLAVERYVRCPRGGLVRVERCLECDLLQGTLIGDAPEILCAYPEAVPALHLHPGGTADGTSGASAAGPDPGSGRLAVAGRAAVAVDPGPDAERRARGGTAETVTLIFDNDWPDD